MANEATQAELTDELFEQYEQVRKNGAVNMMDRKGVQVVADSLGLFALVDFCDDRYGYSAILTGYAEWSERQ